ncbi:hypothetical protein [Companilactobacillus nodensis]|uniref:Uncharacterized protein n=1 Tax=Companilactobacillus nodensis DSM 19682 = JCM 14932 = NBRC 107160 TaxID=1423775 RepID=A0A0R1KAI4_9LACO|nr:hypothetical protein [Companilactobacillus nodensis]KRK80694.1 hypothetical protein FD03_GL002122 [Companilactobacillus nodensis DSM 19682 = JCM 14932 = NBRC 107160]
MQKLNELWNKFKDVLVDTFSGGKKTGSSGSVVSADEVEKKQRELRDKERKRVEEEYRREHPDQIEQEKMTSFENKTNRLKKHLNIAIITVFGLIVIVFLVLFFV